MALDSLGMFELTAGLPEQVQAAARARPGDRGLRRPAAVRHVVVIGMGGSGMAGEVVAAVAAPMLPVPVVVVKSYECPAFVDAGTLVFAVSSSGETEETIQAAVGCRLRRRRRSWSSPVAAAWPSWPSTWDAARIAVPPDIPQPRARSEPWPPRPSWCSRSMGLYRGGPDGSTPRSTSSSAGGTSWRGRRGQPGRRGGPPDRPDHAAHPRRRVDRRRRRPAVEDAGQRERQGAGLVERPARSCATTRSAAGASTATSPGSSSRRWSLRHDAEHPQVGRRFDLVGELLREVVADVIEVRAQGDGDLAQLFDLILFGDYVSLWMAVEAGIDPGPVPVLTDLKVRTRTGVACRGTSAGLWLQVDASRRRNDPRKATGGC